MLKGMIHSVLHLLPSTTKNQPFLLIKRYPKTTQLSELCPSIMSLTPCEPKTHKILLFPTQKVGERTSEVHLEKTILKTGNKVLFQATWSTLSQVQSWECSEKSKARDGYKSRLVYFALCSPPHSAGNYMEMTKGRIETSTRPQLFMQSRAVHSRAGRQFSGRSFIPTFQSRASHHKFWTGITSPWSTSISTIDPRQILAPRNVSIEQLIRQFPLLYHKSTLLSIYSWSSSTGHQLSQST